MEFNGWNSFEDLARACGYTNCNKNTNDSSKTNNNSTANNSSDMGCYDIPNGFQSLNPELFIVIGEILGNMIAGRIPFNVQNAIGNWLQLVGQAIETYNAQQQYFQGGPGRYFNPKYYNESNSFCNNSSTDNNSNTGSNKSKEKDSNYDYNIKSFIENNNNKIEKLELHINQLRSEIEQLKNKIEN